MNNVKISYEAMKLQPQSDVLVFASHMSIIAHTLKRARALSNWNKMLNFFLNLFLILMRIFLVEKKGGKCYKLSSH